MYMVDSRWKHWRYHRQWKNSRRSTNTYKGAKQIALVKSTTLSTPLVSRDVTTRMNDLLPTVTNNILLRVKSVIDLEGKLKSEHHYKVSASKYLYCRNISNNNTPALVARISKEHWIFLIVQSQLLFTGCVC